MKTTLELSFDTGNAAFDGGNGPIEAARLLRHTASRIERGTDAGMIFDINGNKVGSWSVDFPDQDED